MDPEPIGLPLLPGVLAGDGVFFCGVSFGGLGDRVFFGFEGLGDRAFFGFEGLGDDAAAVFFVEAGVDDAAAVFFLDLIENIKCSKFGTKSLE